jgi:hypothetical protein
MRHAALLAAFVAMPALAADMPSYLPPPPGPIVELPANWCTVGRRTEIYRAPEDEFSGFLPAGMLVEVIDAPWSSWTDLWIRVRPIRPGNYYGWVETRDFDCR